MNLSIGNNKFQNVEIPILWGDRAVLQDKENNISIIDLSEEKARVEILGDEPAPDIDYLPSPSGFDIKKNGEKIYSYNPEEKLISSLNLGELPDCQITSNGIIVGTNRFMDNMISGFKVGIIIKENEFAIGSSNLPPKLAKFEID